MKQLALLLVPVVLVADTAIAGDVDWLLGCWETPDRRETEIWVQEPDGSLIGFSVAVRDDSVVFYEVLRIANGADGTLTYTAYPSGQASASFRLKETSEHSVLFANPAHDYPEEIAYSLAGDELSATISATGGKNPRSFNKRRCVRDG